jgi:type IV pilus assembly protein PilE
MQTSSVTVLHRRMKGFSLIEVMVVVTIIGIIAAIAWPSYTDYVIRARRDAGKACLTQAAQQAERVYTTDLSYANIPAVFACDSSVAPFYAVRTTASAARTYTLSAVPTAAQPDGECGTMTLNQAGVKTPGTAGCW